MSTDRPRPVIKPPTAQESVLRELRRQLAGGVLRPGEPMQMEALAESFGVSRVPVREAMRILEGEGLVDYTPHRGYTAARLDVAEVTEIYRLREILETEAVRVGLPRLGAADLASMAEATQQVDAACQAEDLAALTAANRRFHFALFTPCGMPRLLRILEQIWSASDQYRALYFGVAPHREQMREEHRRIQDAALARDEAALLRFLDAHRAHSVPLVTGLVRRATAPAGT
ncbi:GntR family transcriptional regulator [Pseudoroseomonas globiformis]|uniref:GntR family transcriptional regulator n=1 Tax=Teichococcus globiformis TaxID=2307229 RepID=A0ABV7G3P7_9PROT